MAGTPPPGTNGNEESMTPNSNPEFDRAALEQYGPLIHSAGGAFLRAISEARSEHLTYEQMDAWVEDGMDQTARELVLAHIGLCDFCAKQLASYEAYAPVMSAPTAVPAKLLPLGERLRAVFKAPQIAMVALAVVVAILGPVVIRNSRSWGHGATAIESLPAPIQRATDEILHSDAPLRPAALADLPAGIDAAISYPTSEVIEERQPVLRWKAFANSYLVSVKDASGKVVAEGAGLASTEWKVPGGLIRGAMYLWEVRAMDAAEVHRAAFKILSEADEQTLAQLRAASTKPLLMGAVDQQFGMLTAARQEFEKLSSSESAKLLDHLNS